MAIVCGTDVSPASITACEVAALIASAHDEPLVLVDAVADPEASDESALRDLAARLGKDGVQVSTSVRAGAADEVLMAEVERTGARHRARLGRWPRPQDPPRQHQ